MSATVWGIALACGWGFSAFFVRRVVGQVGPQNVTIWLQLIGTLFLAFVTPFPAAGSGISGPVIAAALATTLAGWLGLVVLYEGLRVGKTGVVLALAACGPLVPIVLAALGGEPVRLLGWGSIALVFAGISVLTLFRGGGEEQQATSGALWGLANLILGGISLYCFRLTVGLADPATALIWIKGSGVLWYGGLVLIALVKSQSFAPLAYGRTNWLQLLIAGGCDAVAGMSLAQGYALAGGTALVSALGALYPLVTTALVWLSAGEKLSRPQLAGMALALAGAVGLAVL